MTFFETLKEYWQMILSGGAFFAWLFRLEVGQRTNDSEVAKLWRARENDRLRAEATRNENNDMLHEMRTDMKKVLEQVGELKGAINGRVK